MDFFSNKNSNQTPSLPSADTVSSALPAGSSSEPPAARRAASAEEKSARAFRKLDANLADFSFMLREEIAPVLRIIAEKYCPSVLPVTKGRVRIIDFYNPLNFTAEAHSESTTMTVRRHSGKWYVCFWSEGCRIISEDTLREDKRIDSFEGSLAGEFFRGLCQKAESDIERDFNAFAQPEGCGELVLI